MLDNTTCLERCCWTQRGVEWAYAGEKWRRPTMMDRLSTVDAKTLGDVVYGSLPKPDWFQGRYTPLTSEVVPCLQPGTVIFVESEYLPQFFSEVRRGMSVGWLRLPRPAVPASSPSAAAPGAAAAVHALLQVHDSIKVKYVLISGDSDVRTPGSHGQYIDDEKWVPFLALRPATLSCAQHLERLQSAPKAGALGVLTVCLPCLPPSQQDHPLVWDELQPQHAERAARPLHVHAQRHLPGEGGGFI